MDPPKYDINSIPIASAEPVIDLSMPIPSPPNYNIHREQQQQRNENQIIQLIDQGYTRGLINSMYINNNIISHRIWIIDNSGSMQVDDGNRIVETNNRNDVKMISCTRWEEITECIKYHIQLSGLLNAPTSFRFLNNPGSYVGPQKFDVATNNIDNGVQNGLNIISRARPNGVTPLTSHILEISNEISKISNELFHAGKKIAIIIATDGLPTNERGYGGDHIQKEFINALRSLKGLPIWLVIRLCTNEDNVVEFYNNLDSQLEDIGLTIEVLDDFNSEGEEVYKHNKWLNYALPIHRMRELAYHDRVFDMIDERTLTRTELRDFCYLLFGAEHFDGAPDPNIEFNEFITFIDKLLKKEKLQWNPVKKRMMPWIDIHSLKSIYGESEGCTIM